MYISYDDTAAIPAVPPRRELERGIETAMFDCKGKMSGCEKAVGDHAQVAER